MSLSISVKKIRDNISPPSSSSNFFCDNIRLLDIIRDVNEWNNEGDLAFITSYAKLYDGGLLYNMFESFYKSRYIPDETMKRFIDHLCNNGINVDHESLFRTPRSDNPQPVRQVWYNELN